MYKQSFEHQAADVDSTESIYTCTGSFIGGRPALICTKAINEKRGSKPLALVLWEKVFQKLSFHFQALNVC